MSVSPADLAQDLKALSSFLETRSYLTGYAPTSDDAECCAAVSKAPDAKSFLHAARWYKHITSFTDEERSAWPKGSGSLACKVSKASAAAVEEEEEEEEDDDLFASGDEAEKAHEEALKAKVAAAAAARGGPKEVKKQRSLIVLEVKPNDVETDLEAMALKIKSDISHPGIQNWGDEHKLVPVAFGIRKLVISVVVWDDDIDTEKIEELITELFPDDVQSVDTATMSKV